MNAYRKFPFSLLLFLLITAISGDSDRFVMPGDRIRAFLASQK